VFVAFSGLDMEGNAVVDLIHSSSPDAVVAVGGFRAHDIGSASPSGPVAQGWRSYGGARDRAPMTRATISGRHGGHRRRRHTSRAPLALRKAARRHQLKLPKSRVLSVFGQRRRKTTLLRFPCDDPRPTSAPRVWASTW
jgi:hypothetical protein